MASRRLSIAETRSLTKKNTVKEGRLRWGSSILAPANERQAAPATSFDPDGIQNMLPLELWYFSWPTCRRGSCWKPAGGGRVSEGGAPTPPVSLSAQSTLLISLTRPPPPPPLLHLFTSSLRRLNASRLSANEAPAHVSHQRRQLRPWLQGGWRGIWGEGREKKNKKINTVSFS